MSCRASHCCPQLVSGPVPAAPRTEIGTRTYAPTRYCVPRVAREQLAGAQRRARAQKGGRIGATNSIGAFELAPEQAAVCRHDAQVLVQQRRQVLARRVLVHVDAIQTLDGPCEPAQP